MYYKIKKYLCILAALAILAGSVGFLPVSASAAPGPCPILVVVSNSPSNAFGLYMCEILKAEGFNEFETGNINNLTDEYLQQFDIVILTEMPVTTAQSDMLKRYVNGGGNLVGLRPNASLYDVFGVSIGGAAAD